MAAIRLCPDTIEVGGVNLSVAATSVDGGHLDIAVYVMQSPGWPATDDISTDNVVVELIDEAGGTRGEAQPAGVAVQVGGSLGTTTTLPFRADVGETLPGRIRVTYNRQASDFLVEAAG